MKKIDFEAHYYTQDFFDAIADREGIPSFRTSDQSMYHGGDGRIGIRPIIPKLLELGEKRIKVRDDAGVYTPILSASLGVEMYLQKWELKKLKK